MEKVAISVIDQIKNGLDGRSQRWLALEIKMPETELSKRMNGHVDFEEEILLRIEGRLNFTIDR